MTTNPPKILVIKSNISELERVEIFVNELLEEKKIPKKFFNKVFLCVSEAVINSIQHGNNNDEKKKVSIFADCTSKSVYVEIGDEGKGFNIEEIPNPTLNENVRKESGRGIHIIKSLSEQIGYSKKDNRIQFKINCSE